jgi:hypothetical protein
MNFRNFLHSQMGLSIHNGAQGHICGGGGCGWPLYTLIRQRSWPLDSNEFLSKSRRARSIISSFKKVLPSYCREEPAFNL